MYIFYGYFSIYYKERVNLEEDDQITLPDIFRNCLSLYLVLIVIAIYIWIFEIYIAIYFTRIQQKKNEQKRRSNTAGMPNMERARRGY